MRNRYRILVLLLVIGNVLQAQEEFFYASYYPFVQYEHNFIHNKSAIQAFSDKLFELEVETRAAVNIVHIGDSHTQAAFLTDAIRDRLQQRYGNRGLGLVFPAKYARTHGSRAVRFASNSKKWTYRRLIQSKKNKFLPIGISGMTIQHSLPNLYLQIKDNDKDDKDFAFNKVTFFNEKGSRYFDFSLLPKYDYYEAEPILVNNSAVDYFAPTSSVTFAEPIRQMTLKLKKHDARQNRLRLYGMVLENTTKKGVLYHSVGVNSAKLSHYLKAPLFFKQLPYLQADLIIVNLGTNDAVDRNLSLATFKLQLNQFLTKIREQCGNVPVLFIGPIDHFYKGKKNTRTKDFSTVMQDFCYENNCAFWDWQQITGDINQWFAHKMSRKDRIHLTKNGYRIVGNLFADSLL